MNAIRCEGDVSCTAGTEYGTGNKMASDFGGEDLLKTALLTLAGAVVFGGLSKVASAVEDASPSKLDRAHMEPGDTKLLTVPHQDGTADNYRIKYIGNGRELDRHVPEFDITRFRDGIQKEHYAGRLQDVDNAVFGNGTKVLDLSVNRMFAGTSDVIHNGFLELSTILHDSEKYARKPVHMDSYGMLAENVGLKAGDGFSLHTDDGVWDITLSKVREARNAVLDVAYSSDDGRTHREAHGVELGMSGAQQKEVYLIDPSDLKGNTGIHPERAEILGLRLDFVHNDPVTKETIVGLSARESGKHAFLQGDSRAFDSIAGNYSK